MTDTQDHNASELTREIRLRLWSRENYVPKGLRQSTWHPVILDEMRVVDEELEEKRDPRNRGKDLVPLVPGPLLRVVPDAADDWYEEPTTAAMGVVRAPHYRVVAADESRTEAELELNS